MTTEYAPPLLDSQKVAHNATTGGDDNCYDDGALQPDDDEAAAAIDFGAATERPLPANAFTHGFGSWCELCGRRIAFMARENNRGTCATCRCTLRELRGSRIMDLGRRAAAHLNLGGHLDQDLVAFRCGESALQGRLEPELAAMVFADAGLPCPPRHTCDRCGSAYSTRDEARDCCPDDHGGSNMEQSTFEREYLEGRRAVTGEPEDLSFMHHDQGGTFEEEFAAGVKLAEYLEKHRGDFDDWGDE